MYYIRVLYILSNKNTTDKFSCYNTFIYQSKREKKKNNIFSETYGQTKIFENLHCVF